MSEVSIQQIFGQAVQQHTAGQFHEAEQLYRRVLAREPGHVDAMHNLGVIAQQVARDDLAVSLIRRAIALRPDFPQAYLNLGNSSRAMGERDEAIVAYRQAIHFKPDFVEAYNNLGNTLKDKGELDEAVAAYRRAIAVNPAISQSYNNLGNALKDQAKLDEAIAAYRQAIALDPCTAEASSNLLITLQYHAGYDARAMADEHRKWSRQCAEPLRKFIPAAYFNDPNPDRRLKIGYVSPDFRDHVVGRNLVPLFGNQDRRQFEITCYAHVSEPDAMTRWFQQHADRWRNIVGVPDEQVAKQIHDDGIDILVDLAVHSAGNRLLVFARKPAPVQVTFAGYPGTTGLETIDYRLTDRYVDPPGMDESVYTEQTIRFSDSFWCYDPLDGRDVPINSLPALETGVVTFGCLNTFCKINEVGIRLWARVLEQVKGSRLLLLGHAGSHQQWALDQFSREGIDLDRIEFIPPRSRVEYLKLYHRIDLGLDSIPCTGHVTSMDSFWMGVPVVTLIGQRAAARAGWCEVSNLGMPELAGQTGEQFVQIAVELANNLPRLKELRSTLRQRMLQSPLMDGPKCARDVEAAYRQMWRKWCETKSQR